MTDDPSYRQYQAEVERIRKQDTLGSMMSAYLDTYEICVHKL